MRRAVLVCGFDGLDEVSLAAPTMARVVEGDQFYTDEWDRDDFGLEAVAQADIQAANAADSAATVRRVLAGEDGPARRIVLANAAASLWVTGTVPNFRAGVEMAEESIGSGAARGVLARLVSG